MQRASTYESPLDAQHHGFDMINIIDHIDRMKVNSAELKMHLGRYLRDVEQGQLPLEVCIRDRTVAYLVPANLAGQWPESPERAEALPFLSLKQAGFKVEMATNPAGVQIRPVLAGDGRNHVVTVEEMRRGRDW